MLPAEQLYGELEKQRQGMVDDALKMLAIPAINPRSGGEGEHERALWIREWLTRRGLPCETISVADDAVPEGARLSILARLDAEKKPVPTLWFLAHIDTVHYGDAGQWAENPLTPACRDGKMMGLGAEDNGQAVITGLYLAELLHRHAELQNINIAFLFFSDEETGSHFSLKPMVERGYFQKGDMAIIPDSGNDKGDFVEIAEKSVLWLQFTVQGKQAHGARPHTGVNAASAGARLAVDLEDRLRARFSREDPLFYPSRSTFELTRRNGGATGVNVIPGEDVFCMDMRVLPGYTLGEVLDCVNACVAERMKRDKVKIQYETMQREESPPTSPDSPLAQALATSLKRHGVSPRFGGIGGITCASALRSAGVDSVVWSKIVGMAHKANEFSLVENWDFDMRVFLETFTALDANR